MFTNQKLFKNIRDFALLDINLKWLWDPKIAASCSMRGTCYISAGARCTLIFGLHLTLSSPCSTQRVYANRQSIRPLAVPGKACAESAVLVPCGYSALVPEQAHGKCSRGPSTVPFTCQLKVQALQYSCNHYYECRHNWLLHYCLPHYFAGPAAGNRHTI